MHICRWKTCVYSQSNQISAQVRLLGLLPAGKKSGIPKYPALLSLFLISVEELFKWIHIVVAVSAVIAVRLLAAIWQFVSGLVIA